MTAFKDFLAEQLQDPEIRAEYEVVMQDVQEKPADAQAQHQAGCGRPLAEILMESEQKYGV